MMAGGGRSWAVLCSASVGAFGAKRINPHDFDDPLTFPHELDVLMDCRNMRVQSLKEPGGPPEDSPERTLRT
ncbi:hypothetical protein EYF80_047008 [Liparis tanakae]|uniref:Uncharacterized protein n=1 Tax=Liparis tanakae TaxID=230148 RepID=A0A4Z2FNS5_9TELE|nr:hypothetical protein EYF80_047008 [Liparis tanakae]